MHYAPWNWFSGGGAVALRPPSSGGASFCADTAPNPIAQQKADLGPGRGYCLVCS